MFVQTPLQRIRLTGQMQIPALQFGAAAGQTYPHAPQLCGSEPR
jgi:hypothetical protein